jgi:triosephosphate isomerase
MIAYEPVWAIGTGVSASISDASTMADAIRTWLDEHIESPEMIVPILYGGSVNPSNTLELLLEPNIDGVLVGSASLDPTSFASICAAGAEAMESD